MKACTHNFWSYWWIWKDVVPSCVNSQWLFSVFFISGADLITTRERGSPARLQSKHRSRFIITLMTIGNFVRGDLWGALRSRKKCHSFFWAKKLSRPPMLHRDVPRGGTRVAFDPSPNIPFVNSFLWPEEATLHKASIPFQANVTMKEEKQDAEKHGA